MTERPNSVETLLRRASQLEPGIMLLIETSNQGGDHRYRVMNDFGDAVGDELRHRDMAVVQFDAKAELDAKLTQVEASFDADPGNCFGARFTTIESGAIVDVLILGYDDFVRFEDQTD